MLPPENPRQKKPQPRSYVPMEMHARGDGRKSQSCLCAVVTPPTLSFFSIQVDVFRASHPASCTRTAIFLHACDDLTIMVTQESEQLAQVPVLGQVVHDGPEDGAVYPLVGDGAAGPVLVHQVQQPHL